MLALKVAGEDDTRRNRHHLARMHMPQLILKDRTVLSARSVTQRGWTFTVLMEQRYVTRNTTSLGGAGLEILSAARCAHRAPKKKPPEGGWSEQLMLYLPRLRARPA